jgi:hypothetical protein
MNEPQWVKCCDCKCWNNKTRDPDEEHSCFRHPPVPAYTGSGVVVNQYPRTYGTWGCWDGVPRNDPAK